MITAEKMIAANALWFWEKLNENMVDDLDLQKDFKD